MKCQKCGVAMWSLPEGVYLQRVNERGVAGIWECRPACDEPLPTQEDALIAAIEGQRPTPPAGARE